MSIRKKTLVNWLGVLGLVSLLSFTVAIIFAPLAYPGYDWKSQAVSDLSAANAPSRTLFTQLNSLFGPCGIVCLMMVCINIQNRLRKPTRWGIYLFTAMTWVVNIGYTMFPLSESGFAESFQDIMHGVVTLLVVLLSLTSLAMIIIGGFGKKSFLSLAAWAFVTLLCMLVGAVGVIIVPSEYFGMVQRVSLFSTAIFTAVLGLYLFFGKFDAMDTHFTATKK